VLVRTELRRNDITVRAIWMRTCGRSAATASRCRAGSSQLIANAIEAMTAVCERAQAAGDSDRRGRRRRDRLRQGLGCGTCRTVVRAVCSSRSTPPSPKAWE